MEKTIIIYAQLPGVGTASGPDSTTPGGDILYPLLEAVADAINFAPADSMGAQDLGGLVAHCWIQGDSYMFSPDIDPGGQGMATIPVRILIP
jgi:hypothetical protein